MLTKFFNQSISPPTEAPKEGDLYKTLYIKGTKFDLYYGYYEDIDRQYNEPDVIYPDFLKKPQFTEDGFPFSTLMQDACEHFDGIRSPESDCSQCKHFIRCEDFIGICTHRLKRKSYTIQGEKENA